MAGPTNILLITSDQQHFSTLGSVNERISTPALDRLCNEGIRFDRAYCPNPTCTPTRASIITGMYPSQHGAWSLGTKLFENVPVVGDIFQKAGYYTSLIGKAHFQPLATTPEYPGIECQPTMRELDFWRDFHGPWYGFEHIETARMHGCESHAGQHYAIWMEDRGFTNWRDYFEDWPDNPEKKEQLRSNRHWAIPEEFHYTTWTGERTIAQIDKAASQDQPFFIWSSFHDPHPPYVVSEPWASMYDPDKMIPGMLSEGEHSKNPPHFAETQKKDADFRRIFGPDSNEDIHGGQSQVRSTEELKKDMACYYGMVSFMDQQIGRILNALDRNGLAENTLIVFTTDHGHFLGQHGLTAKAIHHYEDLLRVPFIVRYPGRCRAGKTSDDLQNLVDLAPTFLAAAGIEKPVYMTGINQLGNWTEGKEVRDASITENHHGTEVVHLRSFVTKRWKITVYRTWEQGELFDLDNDPTEINNLWDDPEHRSVKCELLRKFMQETMKSEQTKMPRIANA